MMVALLKETKMRLESQTPSNLLQGDTMGQYEQTDRPIGTWTKSVSECWRGWIKLQLKRSHPELSVQSLCERHVRWMKLQNVDLNSDGHPSYEPPSSHKRQVAKSPGNVSEICRATALSATPRHANSMSSITQNPVTRTLMVSASRAKAIECNSRHSW